MAADPQQLAVSLKAQTEFDHVWLTAAPQLGETQACVQSQAAALSVASREDLPALDYRKGYCLLVGATIDHSQADFTGAADAFDKAIEAWPAHFPAKTPPQPVPSGLRILASIAHLEADAGAEGVPPSADRAQKEIFAAVTTPVCSSNLMHETACDMLLTAGREWLGWIDIKRDDVLQAGSDLTPVEGTGWRAWARGMEAFRDRSYPEAARDYRQAIDEWNRRPAGEGPLAERVSPRPDMPQALTDLGGAQLLAGDTTGAIATLSVAIKRDPSNARAFYLRARALETSGKMEQALADYNLASRTAFANAKDLASGEAHLYRGITYYLKKDYPRAEDEFSSALNFQIPEKERADATAWRHLAIIASGSCDVSASFLEQALEQVSPYFPKDEARAALTTCANTASVARPK